MAKWKLEKNKYHPVQTSQLVTVHLSRGADVAGLMFGWVRNNPGGQKYFEAGNLWRMPGLQQRYMKKHKGTKMGEAIFWVLLSHLKKSGVQYITPGSTSSSGEKFIQKFVDAGILERKPGGLLRIRFEKIQNKEAWLKTIRKIRAKEGFGKAKRKALPGRAQGRRPR